MEQHAPVLGGDEDDYPPRALWGAMVVMADPLVEVAVRVYADYAEQATLADIARVP